MASVVLEQQTRGGRQWITSATSPTTTHRNPVTAAANRIREKLAVVADRDDPGGYRKADYHNLEAFMTQAAMTLTRFPRDIIEYVSAPDNRYSDTITMAAKSRGNY